MTLEDEAFVLSFDEGEASGNTGEDGAHAASDDVHGTIRYWNHAAQGLYGWTAEEALGKIPHDLIKDDLPGGRSDNFLLADHSGPIIWIAVSE